MPLSITVTGLPGPGGVAPSTQVDFNAFYDGPAFSYNGSNNNIVNSVKTRQDSTAYRVGDIVRLAAVERCASDADANCYLYRVTAAGTSAAGRPDYCANLGCVTNDGGMALQAIRGPYTYYRKLQTAPEPYSIPYTRVHTSAPEAGACPASYNARPGVGIGDAG